MTLTGDEDREAPRSVVRHPDRQADRLPSIQAQLILVAALSNALFDRLRDRSRTLAPRIVRREDHPVGQLARHSPHQRALTEIAPPAASEDHQELAIGDLAQRPEGRRQRRIRVGVVDEDREGLTGNERPQAYFSLPQFRGHYSFVSGRHVYLAVRAAGTPENMVQSVRREIAVLDGRVAVTDIRSTAGLVADSAAAPRFRAILIGSFAVLALLVALVGIYGVMSFVVAQRKHEIGVRMALGASSAGVLKHVLLGGTRLIVLGVTVGTVVAIATSRTLSVMLFGITPGDPITFSSVSALLALVALVACYAPARRASRVDPMGALRVD